MNNDVEHDEVDLAIRGLMAQCNTLSVECLSDPMIQYQFRNEYVHIGKCLKSDYEEGKITKDDVVIYVKKERRSLIEQARALAQYGIGAIGGIAQVTGGYAICASTPLTTIAGVALCGTVGVSMVSHGANNIYENSANIMDYLNGEQEVSNVGWVKEGYRSASKTLGYGVREADLAYSSVDLGLSIYGLVNVIKKVPYASAPDATQFKLFRHLAADYQKGWRTMSKPALFGEAYGNYNTINGMRKSPDE